MMTSGDSGKKRKRALFRIFLLLGILAAIGAGWTFFKKTSLSKTQAANTTVITIEQGNIQDIVTAQGKLEPREYVDVGVQVSGQLEKIHVEIGDTVKLGDLIAEIDPDLYVARVEADQANLKRLNAQLMQQDASLIQAQLKFERNEKLVKSKAISQEIFEAAEAEYKVAQAQLEALKAQIEEAQSTLDGDMANLGYTKIFAPMDGTVVQQTTREGQTVNSSQSAPTIVQLANLDTMTARAQVAEADVMRLKPGMEMYFTTLGSGERRWTGTIRQILPTPEVINDVVLYNVLVDVDNKDRQLMTGMSTQMFFVIARAQGVPVIPVSALGKRNPKADNDSGQAYQVRALDGRKQIEKTIHIGLMDRTMAEIKAGLNLKDQVVVIRSPSASAAASQQSGARGGLRGGMPRL
jgi:macrolide-specific efflux system membrane fusion protein